MKKRFVILFMLVTIGSLTISAQSLEKLLSQYIDIVVSKDGTGHATTVQEAINLIPDYNPTRKVIFIRNGIYKEKITMTKNKSNITLVGQNADSVILTYDDYSGREVDGVIIGTNISFSFAADAPDFTAMNLTFKNSAGQVGQAVALRTDADRQVFYHCRLIGNQDTYYTWGHCRNYLRQCYIEGTTDYIFGRSTVVFDSCHIHSLKTGSFITAASTELNVKYGYVFRNCRFTGATDINRVFLGRPWRPYGRTVIINSYLDWLINSEGWSIWKGNENHLTCYYAEYENFGPGASTVSRIEWSHQLSISEVKNYSLQNIFLKETNPQYFKNDWIPTLESDPVYKAVKASLTRGLD